MDISKINKRAVRSAVTTLKKNGLLTAETKLEVGMDVVITTLKVPVDCIQPKKKVRMTKRKTKSAC